MMNRYEDGPGVKAAKIAVKRGVSYDLDRRRFVSDYNPKACEEAQAELDAWKEKDRLRSLRLQP